MSFVQLISDKDKKYTISVDGKKRILQVHDVTSKNEGEYSCKVQNKVTTAKLYVARTCLVYSIDSRCCIALIYPLIMMLCFNRTVSLRKAL